MELCTKLTGMERREGAFLLHTDCADLKLVFVTDEILRLRVAFDRKLIEESYVLMTTAWPDRLDPLFEGERSRVAPVEPTLTETAQTLIFETDALRLELDREPLCLRLFDRAGTLLWATVPDCPFTRDRNERVTLYSRMEEDDCFYGFGEKTGPLNKNKCFLRERATDAMGYDPERCDTLYKHIPFSIRLHRRSGQALGLFFHNFHESVYNLGAEKSNYRPRYAYWQADGGDIDLFLLGGGTIARVVDNYTLLTGRPALLPKRALGYQGSSMYYAELEKDSDKAVLGFADTVRREGFPLDGFHLSSGYTALEGKRCVFEWNRERFPDPAPFFAAMEKKGAPCVPNVKPGVLLSHPRYAELAAKGAFVRDSSDPSRPAVGPWWGGAGSLWDYTDPAARTLWKDCLKKSLLRYGLRSVWNDNCEYDSLLDLDARCDFDGRGGALAALKPLMSTLMCALAAEAVHESDPDARPYVVCRSGSAGIQRYAQTWCGDNYTSWESLRWNIPTILGMGLSGQPNEGADIGGFAGRAPEEELFVRWVQNGVFQPRFSIHSASDDNTVTEPWMYSGSENLIRDAMLLRYRLTPALYSALYEAHCNGAPILRPLVWEFQDDPRARDESFSFLFGRDLLVANVLEKGAKTRRVYLPAGCTWYDWNDNWRPYAGGQEIEVPVSLETIPLFLREGAILPLAAEPPMNMEREKIRALHLLLAPGRDSSFTLYDDDGVSEAWRRGESRKTRIELRGRDRVEISFRAEGAYPDFVERVTVEMLRRDRSPYWVRLGEKLLPRYTNRHAFEAADSGWYYSQTKRAVLIRYPNPKQDLELTVSFEDFDLIGM